MFGRCTMFRRKLPFVSLIVFLLIAVSGCESEAMLKVRKLPIDHIDLQAVLDGNYQGGYSYGNFSYGVEVSVTNHRITGISVTQNRKTSHAKKAEGVIKEIIDEQRNDVDAIAGATTTSKALLKAVETALGKGLRQEAHLISE
jgi:uncharacterized protein with FMN-binding domain